MFISDFNSKIFMHHISTQKKKKLFEIKISHYFE